MKVALIIFIFLSIHVHAQVSAQWETASEKYVINYEVQKSVDNKNWTSFQKIQPINKDTNYYICSLPLMTNYYRVKANMINGVYFTKTIKVTTMVDAGKDEVIKLPTNNLNISGSYSQQTN